MDRRTVIVPESVANLSWQEGVKVPSLVQLTGAHVGRRHILQPFPLLVGRSPECAIQVEDPSVSRHHARIWCGDGEEVMFEDLESSNGSFINNVRLTRPTPLFDKDILRLGKVIFKLYAYDYLDSYLHDHIYRRATLDQATGTFNREYLNETLRAQFHSAKRFGHALSLVFLDLDFFKGVNDRYGHAAGDQVLQLASILIKQNLRRRDIFGRYGGEEFLLILPHTDLGNARVLAERLRQLVADYHFYLVLRVEGERRIALHRQTLSAGVAELGDHITAEALVADADAKLYQAKRAGRDRVTV